MIAEGSCDNQDSFDQNESFHKIQLWSLESIIFSQYI